MIVKNESKIIKRLLTSVSSIIDYYVICDTGSTDDTINIINNFFIGKGIEGKIIEHEWVNFGHNRSLALYEAQKYYDYDYILLLDADMELIIGNFDKNNLTDSVYFIKQVNNNLSYYNVRMIKKTMNVKCICPTHEYYDIDEPKTEKYMDDNILYINDIGDGGSKADKYERDIKLLEDALIHDQHNPRYIFYLAQSYEGTGNIEKAIKYYNKRCDMKGWNEEIYISTFRIGNLYMKEGKHIDAIYYYLECCNINKNRVESIHKLAEYYRKKNNYMMANHFCDLGLSILDTNVDDNYFLFKEKKVYEYLMMYEKSISVYYSHSPKKYKYKNGLYISNYLLLNKDKLNIEDNIYNNILSNIKFYLEPLKIESNKIFDMYDLHPTGFNFKNAYNPSITLYKGFKYVSFRLSNYNLKIENNKMYYKVYDGDNLQNISIEHPIRSKTEICILDDDMDLFHIDKFIFLDSIFKYRSCIRGIEDIRLITFNDLIYMVGNSCELNENNINKMVCVIYDPQSSNIQFLELHGYEDHKVQKNWSPFVHDNKLLFVYSFNPLVILEPCLSTGKCTVYKNENQNLYYNNFRGGSQGFYIDDYLYFIVHEVIHENGRIYIHRIVKMYNTYIVKVSEPFYINNLGIEYISGSLYDENLNNIIITWGSNDNKANISTITKENFMNMF